jgi:hypothetical protein
MVDVVIPYWKPPHGDHELKFALRSIAETVSPERVFLLGDCPDWVTGVERSSGGGEGLSPQVNVMKKLRFFLEEDISDEFLLWNDDMFVLNDGQIFNQCATETLGQLHSRTSGVYARAVEGTMKCLGSKSPHAELHVPLWIQTQALREVLERHHEPILFRTLAVAWAGASVWRVTDSLAKDPDEVPGLMANRPWFSTLDAVSCDPVFTKAMTARFPEPCRFEKG